MVVARMDRKHNTSIDYLQSKYGLHYSLDIIRALHKMLGTKETTNVLNRCNYLQKGVETKPHLIKGIVEESKKQYYRLLVLQGVLVENHFLSPGFENTMTLCIRQISVIDRANGEKRRLGTAKAGEIRNDSDYTTYEQELRWQICVSFAYIAGLAKRRAVVDCINRYLSKGCLGQKAMRELAIRLKLRLPEECQKYYAFSQIIFVAVEKCVDQKTSNEMQVKLRWEKFRYDNHFRLYNPTLVGICP